jgi:multiple sugar transport system substrate-binding protein
MKTVKLSRRQFLLAGGSGMAAIALAACAQPAPAPAPAKAEPTKAPVAAAPTTAPAAAPAAKKQPDVDFFAWGDPVDVPAWNKVAELYTQKTGNKANVTIGATGDFYTKLQTMVAGGTPPHVSSFQGWEWQVFADKGVLVPVDEQVKLANLESIFIDAPGDIAYTQRKGKKYLLPIEHPTMLMFYAKKPFQDAGIPFPKDDWTFDQFLEIAQKLTKTVEGKKQFGYQANGIWARDIHWMRNTGQQEFDVLIDPKKSTFNQPEIAEILQIVASDVYYKMKISPTPADLEGGANTIDTGNCAMKYEGPWYFVRLNTPPLREQKKAVEFDVVIMPRQKDAARPHRCLTSGVTLLKTDKVDAAWAFASYLVSYEGNKVYSEISGRLPNNPKGAEQDWVPRIKDLHGVSNGRAFIDAFKTSVVDVVGGVPRSKIWNEAAKPLGWDPLTLGTAKATEVLPKVDAKVQELLDAYWATQPKS